MCLYRYTLHVKYRMLILYTDLKFCDTIHSPTYRRQNGKGTWEKPEVTLLQTTLSFTWK